MKKEAVKIRYSESELRLIAEKAKSIGKTVNEYQRETSIKAKIKIEVPNEKKH